MFHNPFVILVIYKFCYFNWVVSLLHYNHQYHADFDICHDLHGLIIEEHVPHLPVEVPSYIISHQVGTIIHACLNKKKQVYVFAKRIKGRPAQKPPRRWWVVIAVGSPLRHLWRQDDAIVLDIVVVKRARHDEYRWLLVGLPNEVHPGLISEVIHLAVAPPDALLLYIHLVRGHSQCQQRPSSQRTRIHDRSVVTYVADWASGDDEMDGVTAPLSDAVPRTTQESPALVTTLRSPCLRWTTRCNRSGSRPSGGCGGACRTQRRMWPRSTASKGRTGSRQASSRRRWAMPTRAPPASGVCLGFPSKKHGFIFSVGLWKWLTSQIHGKILRRINVTHIKKNLSWKHYSNKKKLHARLFFKYYSLHPKI
jgi:hypothetical protein